MGWWKWRVCHDTRSTDETPILNYCQDINCPNKHFGYEAFHGRHSSVLDKWDYMRDSDGRVGK
ncbi:hypothetical protein [Mycobacterium phage WXIN]|nr:hypothetical protein [Mycobacterium phage WXIN]